MNIWVNGCFDIIHCGHIDLLTYAKNLNGDDNTLIVGLDTDERVKENKGSERPINDLPTRIKLMRSLWMVDGVVFFKSDSELREYIKKLEIDYMVIGDQYSKAIGEENSKFGVKYYKVGDESTTNIIDKIKNLK